MYWICLSSASKIIKIYISSMNCVVNRPKLLCWHSSVLDVVLLNIDFMTLKILLYHVIFFEGENLLEYYYCNFIPHDIMSKNNLLTNLGITYLHFFLQTCQKGQTSPQIAFKAKLRHGIVQRSLAGILSTTTRTLQCPMLMEPPPPWVGQKRPVSTPVNGCP